MLGDPLRAVAALGVVGTHLVNVTVQDSGATARESFGLVAGRLLGNLYIGLYVFFALSGYLIGKPFVTAWLAGERGPRFRPYVARRLLRIVPAFWLCALLAIVVLGLRGTRTSEALLFFGFAQDFNPSALSDSFAQAWSLHSELVFYLLLPLAFAGGALVARRHRLAWLLGALAVCWVASLAAIAFGPDERVWGRFPTTLFAFVPGVLLAAIAPRATAALRGRSRRWLTRATLLALAAGCAGLLLFVVLPVNRPATRAAVVSLAMLVLIGTALAREWAGLRPWRALDNPVMHWLGERSYGIYIIHFVVIVEVVPQIDATAPVARLLIAAAICVPITLVLAALSWRFFERPILRYRTRLGATAR